MSLSASGAPTSDIKLTKLRTTSLNPNASEFIPSALKLSPAASSTADTSSTLAPVVAATSGKTVLNRSESSVSNNSDDEAAHHYLIQQLPDDITPDFKVMGEDDSDGINSLPFSSFSLNDVSEVSRFSSTGSGYMPREQLQSHPNHMNGSSLVGRFPSSVGSHHFPAKPWDNHFISNGKLLASATEGPAPSSNLSLGFMEDVTSEQPPLNNVDVNRLRKLATQFSGLSAESVAEVYFANGRNLSLTIEMLARLEFQAECGLNHDLNAKASSASNLSALDFPALSAADGLNGVQKHVGDDHQRSISHLYKSGSFPNRGSIDFAAAVRRMVPPDSSVWNYDRNGNANPSVESSRTSYVPAISYSGDHSRGFYGDKFQNWGSARGTPVWLDAGEAVANRYSETLEDAWDHARLRNALFEQARQAYLTGNNALAKELSAKGQIHDLQTKASHENVQESLYHLRNPVGADIHANQRGQEKIIDLHGLHTNEAIPILKRELALLRNAARLADQPLQVYICVGTGHHTRGSRIPRHAMTVQKYLFLNGVDFSETQPGLLRVVIN